MLPKKTATPATSTELPAPNAGELDVLAVLWRERAAGGQPLQLSEVHRRVSERRRAFREAEPATTTISTQLRSLLAKGLIEETTVGQQPTEAPAHGRPVPVRGGMRPASRSPLTSYQALHQPGEVLRGMFTGLAEAYPPEAPHRLDALLDFAAVLGLPDEVLQRLLAFVEDERAACAPPPHLGDEPGPETSMGGNS